MPASILAHVLTISTLTQPVTTLQIPPPPNPAHATIAEASDWKATSTHAQVVELMEKLAAGAPTVSHHTNFGRSFEGRDLPLLILSDPVVQTADQARALADREGRVIVLLFANIHAGEVDAKEAYLILARQLLDAHAGKLAPSAALPSIANASPANDLAKDADLLKRLIILIAPIYNADGNDRFGPPDKNRPYQDGPSEGMGIRHNAMDLDLNRDFGKVESPEALFLTALIRDWDPHVVVDGHTTDGSYHRYLMTYATPKILAGDERLNEFARSFITSVGDALDQRSDIDTFWYGDFEGEHENPPREHHTWGTPPALPRYSTHYVGLRGRIGILSESYSYSPYRDRIVGSLEFAREILRASAANAKAIRDVTEDASRFGSGDGPNSEEIVIRTQELRSPIGAGRVTIKGYAESTKDGRAVSTNEPKDYDCLLLDRVQAERTVTRPIAYAFTENVPAVIDNLKHHGVQIETLAAPRKVQAEVYTIDSATSAANRWQGHILVTIEATPTKSEVTLPAGAAYIPMDQPLGNLAAYFLEPECEDGLTTWNFFDNWCKPGTKFPVIRITK